MDFLVNREPFRFGFFISDASGNAAFALRSSRLYEKLLTDAPAIRDRQHEDKLRLDFCRGVRRLRQARADSEIHRTIASRSTAILRRKPRKADR